MSMHQERVEMVENKNDASEIRRKSEWRARWERGVKNSKSKQKKKVN